MAQKRQSMRFFQINKKKFKHTNEMVNLKTELFGNLQMTAKAMSNIFVSALLTKNLFVIVLMLSVHDFSRKEISKVT